jgi:hypothetical protein
VSVVEGPKNKKLLTRFWIHFDMSNWDVETVVSRYLYRGCGVTAYSLDDAMQILKTELFENTRMPPVKEVITNIDVSTLDEGHIIPNMGIPVDRGVWFPRV